MIAAVVLAAGGSSRMGRPKLLLPFRGRSLVVSVCEEALASPVDRVLAVVGSDAPRVVAALDGLEIDVVANPLWREGLGSSVRVAVRHLLRTEPPAAIAFVLADQPFVTREHLGTLLEALKRSRGGLAASEANGRLGAPAVFGPAFYPALLRASGGEGARKLLRNNRAVAAVVPMPEAALDVDTPLDYERVAAL